MRLKWYSFLVVGIATLLGIAYVRNHYGYVHRSFWWKLRKSTIDTILVVLFAWRLPVVISGWVSVWVTRPVKDPMVRVIIGALFGIAAMFLMDFAFEIMLILSIFSVDLVTGTHGFLRRLSQVENGLEFNDVVT